MATGSQDVFYYWVTDTTSGSSTSTTANDYVWLNWNNYSGTTSGVDHVWDSWNSTTVTYTTGGSDYVWQVWNDEYTPPAKKVPDEVWRPVELTTEQKRARDAQTRIRNEWYEVKRKEQEEAKALAELTAQDLLKDLITVEQFEYYKETGHLVVNGRKYDYVIEKGRGVFKVDKDKVRDLCIHLKNRYSFPDTDNVIGLLLALRTNEKKFLKTANDHGEINDVEKKNKVIELVKKVA
jgi:hypothetical protein